MQSDTREVHIALQDGFDAEPVVVLVNGEEVLRKDDVRTDPRIGLAYAFQVPVPEAPVTIEVRLPRRHLRDSLRLNQGETTHLGVSCVEGALRFKTSSTPFGYV